MDFPGKEVVLLVAEDDCAPDRGDSINKGIGVRGHGNSRNRRTF